MSTAAVRARSLRQRLGAEVRKTDLGPAQVRLLTLFQALAYGRVHGLSVRHGEPVFDPPPRVVRTIKIGGRNSPQPQFGATDFVLRRELVEFFEHLEALGDAKILTIVIADGLPQFFEVEADAAS